MWFWVLIIIAAIWWFSRRTETTQRGVDQSILSGIKKETTEEDVFNAQGRFEKELERDLPGDIGGAARYVYSSLLCKWFEELAGKYRYDEKMTQKLREDFLEWMFSIDQGYSSNYLSFELEDDADKNKYEEESRAYLRKCRAIENGFAAAIGGSATEELERVRNLEHSAIDRFGNLALEGHKFNMDGKLVKKH